MSDPSTYVLILGYSEPSCNEGEEEEEEGEEKEEEEKNVRNISKTRIEAREEKEGESEIMQEVSPSEDIDIPYGVASCGFCGGGDLDLRDYNDIAAE